MDDYERTRYRYTELEPPESIMVDQDHWLHHFPIVTNNTDIRHLPRPLTTIDEEQETSITAPERAMRDEYIDLCKETYSALWGETETFITTTSINESAALEDSAVFDAHLAFNELVQNAFRHGGRPQRLSVSLVRATDTFSIVPNQSQTEESQVKLWSSRAATASGYLILLGVQDASPNWQEHEAIGSDELPEHLRGLDIIRGISKAVWYQSNEKMSKWVWVLI